MPAREAIAPTSFRAPAGSSNSRRATWNSCSASRHPTTSCFGPRAHAGDHEPRPVDAPQFAVTTRSLADRETTIDAWSVVSWPHKLITRSGFPPALYDLAADPLELNDLAPERPEEAARFTAEILNRLKDLEDGLKEAGGEFHEADLDLLEALGYAGVGEETPEVER